MQLNPGIPKAPGSCCRAVAGVWWASVTLVAVVAQFPTRAALSLPAPSPPATVTASQEAGPAPVPAAQARPGWLPQVPSLPAPGGEIIRVASVDELLLAVDRLAPGGTVLLADGLYRLPRVIRLDGKRNIALRGASGDPARVTLSGRGWDTESRGDDLLHIARCEGVLIADLTFADCRSYGIKVEAENAPKDIHIYHCRFRGIGVRAIKGSAGQDPSVRAVKGSVRCCDFDNTRVPPADWLFGGDYIAAIDMMALEDWTFSDSSSGMPKGSRSCTTRSGVPTTTGAEASAWEPGPHIPKSSTTWCMAKSGSKAAKRA